MAITIDGDGTITGLSAGGLPNDSVQTADIADNQITTGKIGDDQVTLAKMAGGTDGQIITYDASGNPVAVGPGSDGQVLTSTGAGSPPAFEAAAAGGKVVQYVWATDNTNVTCASSSNVEVMDATITPTSSSNKILVQCLTRVYSDASSYAFYGGYIKRGDASGTTIATYSGGFVSSEDIEAMVPIWWLDEPNTTSATEYTLILSRWSSSTTSVTTNSYANSMLLWELEG